MITRLLSLIFVGLMLIQNNVCDACVGRTLYVGTLQSNEGKVMSEMLALLINERTGTSIQIRSFETSEQLYTALKSTKEEERVDIIVEDTAQALSIAQQKAGTSPDQDFIAVKAFYEKELNVVWLNPFGYTANSTQPSISAPLIRKDVLTNFPLLPRVLNKLAGAINDKAFQALKKALDAGDKPKNVAKDFLKKQKLI
ncbi:MAG: glycine betaine ABC transporter substrate-binding protein [Desulfobulbaceae bacterium]|nr:glycine betaine ABC transporter substrate-binding protein [Desulfobulbaceae bacterium]